MDTSASKQKCADQIAGFMTEVGLLAETIVQGVEQLIEVEALDAEDKKFGDMVLNYGSKIVGYINQNKPGELSAASEAHCVELLNMVKHDLILPISAISGSISIIVDFHHYDETSAASLEGIMTSLKDSEVKLRALGKPQPL